MTNLKNLYWLYSKNSIEVRVILHQAAAKSQFYENWLVQMNFDFMYLCHLKVTVMQETKSGWHLSDVGFKVILWPDIIVSIRFFLQTIPLYYIWMNKSFVIRIQSVHSHQIFIIIICSNQDGWLIHKLGSLQQKTNYLKNMD